MKQFLALLSFFACASLLAQVDFLNISPVKAGSRRLLESRSQAKPGQPYDLQQLKELHRAIVGNRPNVWKMPEPMLHAMQAELEPLRFHAKELAKSTIADERYYGAVLNAYLRQTDETQTLLLQLAHDERGETAGTAMDTLFGLKLDTPELRRELVVAMQEDKAPRTHSTMYAMATTNVGKWGVVEALPILIRLLEASSDGTTVVDRNAVRQLKELGPSAANALPLLRRLAEKRRAAGDADFRELEDLDYAVLSVSGEYKARQGNLIQQQPPMPKSSPNVQTPPSKGNSPSSKKEPASSTPWRALIAAILAMAVGLLWWLNQRKT